MHPIEYFFDCEQIYCDTLIEQIPDEYISSEEKEILYKISNQYHYSVLSVDDVQLVMDNYHGPGKVNVCNWKHPTINDNLDYAGHTFLTKSGYIVMRTGFGFENSYFYDIDSISHKGDYAIVSSYCIEYEFGPELIRDIGCEIWIQLNQPYQWNDDTKEWEETPRYVPFEYNIKSIFEANNLSKDNFKKYDFIFYYDNKQWYYYGLPKEPYVLPEIG